VEVSVLSGSLTYLWLPLLGCLLAWTLVLAPCFYFSPFLGCFLFIKFGRASSIALDYRSARFAFLVDLSCNRLEAIGYWILSRPGSV